MELEIIKQLIKKYEPGHVAFSMGCLVAERYYKNENDVLYKPQKEKEDAPVRNADNRIPRNFHGLIVNQKASYAFTAPPLFDTGSVGVNKSVTEALGDEYAKNCMELCVNAANTSLGWVHYWQSENAFQWAVVDSKQVVPIWDNGLKRKLMGVLRIYDEIDEDTGKAYIVYQYWNDEKCQAFRRETAATVDSGIGVYTIFTDASNGEPISEYAHTSGEVPFIPFFNNNTHTDDLKNTKPLIDVYDKVFSGFINDLDDVQELIFILSGYGGTDLNGFLQDLKKYKAIKLDADTDGKPGVSTLNIEIPIEARNSVLLATRKAIFEQAQGFDPQPESFGNQSGEALKFMYSLLEMKSGLMETEFRLGFSKLVRAICVHKGLRCDTIVQTWTRTCIKNDTEQAQICRDSVGIISQKTILKNHPFVEDAEAELKLLEQEKKQAAEEEESYTFNKQGDPSAEDEEEEEEGTDAAGRILEKKV